MEAPNGTRYLVNTHQYVEAQPMPPRAPEFYIDHLAFTTADAEQLRAYLKSKGVEVPAAITKRSDGSNAFFVSDPEGYRIEFVEGARTVVPAGHAGPVSSHIIHAGLAVRNGTAEDRFYKDILGFRLYWHSLPHEDGGIDFVSMQVPDGTDWLEYMQNAPNDRSMKRLTSADHFAPGVVSIEQAQKMLEERGWHSGKTPATRHGNDAKWQLNLHDPAGTRVELMEFEPTGTPTVPFTGPQPKPETHP